MLDSSSCGGETISVMHNWSIGLEVEIKQIRIGEMQVNVKNMFWF